MEAGRRKYTCACRFFGSFIATFGFRVAARTGSGTGTASSGSGIRVSSRGSNVVFVTFITCFLLQGTKDEWPTLAMRELAAQMAPAPKVATPIMEQQVDGAVDRGLVSWPATSPVMVRGVAEGLWQAGKTEW